MFNKKIYKGKQKSMLYKTKEKKKHSREINKIILPDKFGQKTEKIYMNDIRAEKAGNADIIEIKIVIMKFTVKLMSLYSVF